MNYNFFPANLQRELQSLFPIVGLLLLLFLPLNASAQQVEWNVGALGFFDNSEGEHEYRIAQTLAGMRISPEIGLSWDNRKHSINGGVSAITQFGGEKEFLDADILLYYKYDTPHFAFLLGNFMRDQLLGNYPEYMIADSIRYYRPVIQGWAFQYKQKKGYFEAFLDWTNAISEEEREQFMAGLSTEFLFGAFETGLEGYYYHYALTKNSAHIDHIHDYLLAHPYVGLKYNQLAFLDQLEIKAGLLFSMDRERDAENLWNKPIGFLGEIESSWKRFHFKQSVYVGQSQQHYDISNFGKYYWGDTYIRAHFWSHTDLRYQFIKNEWINAYAGIIMNATKQGINHHQVITLSLNLGSRQGNKFTF